MWLSEEKTEIEERLRRHGLDEIELYRKRGRSRRFLFDQGRWIFSGREEQGWAIRAGNRRSSLFLSGVGAALSSTDWPEADGQPLRLPDAEPVPVWQPPSWLGEPLLAESEGWSFVETFLATLGKETPGAILTRLALDDGESNAELASSKGIAGEIRQRLATLRVEAELVGERPCAAALSFCRRAARALDPIALARRMGDLLALKREGGAPTRDRGDLVLAPCVGARILQGLLPLLSGVGAVNLARRLRDRGNRVAGRAVTIIDDGRLAEGLAPAAIDGEGVATARVVLIDEGTFERPLLAWWQETARGTRLGCVQRRSWRDVPRPGPSHLFFRPDPGCSVADLISSIARGYYLIEAAGPAQIEFATDRLRIQVDGLAVEQGRAVRPIAGAWLVGSISGLLHGIEACGRDLTFFALDGLLGAPTMRVVGLELRDQPGQ